MRFQATLLTVGAILAVLFMTSSAPAYSDVDPIRVGIAGPYPYYPYNSLFFYYSPNYYRGRDGRLYPAGPPPVPDTSPSPPGRILPMLRPRRFNTTPGNSSSPMPSYTPSSPAAPQNGSPAQP
jgi:hypothetical protein